LDISPDGKTLIFAILGDIYTLPAEGGQAVRITSGMAFDSQPRFSPDGESIAFVSDRDGADNIWIARVDGTEPKQLSKDKKAEFVSPTWTPDGKYVLTSRSSWGLGTFEIWMYHVRGGSGVQLTKAKGDPKTPRNQRHNALGPIMSPDGRYLYYSMKKGGFQYNVNFPLWQIARRDMRTGDEDILTRSLGSAFRPVISPDGSLLVYGTRYETKTGLRLRNLQTGEDRWLRYPVQRDDQESRFTRDLLPEYAFTPDGKAILVSYGGKIQRVDIATGNARTIPFTANVEQDLGPKLLFPLRVEEGPVRVRLLQGATASPGGNRLAFSALTHIYAMKIPAGIPRRLTGGNAREFQPAWSPDGKWLAYVTWSNGSGQIWKVRADGRGRPRQLSRAPAFYTDPVWSPDGARIVALRGSAHERLYRPFDFGQTPGMDLIWIPADGGDANLIVPSRGLGKPHFGLEKDRVYVHSNKGLISVRFDGTDRREHVKVTGPGFYFSEKPVPADDIRIRPDGKWALAHVGNQLYVVAVPPVGSDAPEVNIDKPALPAARLTRLGADYFGWADDGKTVTWAVGSSFFRQPFDTISFEKPEKDKTKDGEDGEDGEESNEEKNKPPAYGASSEHVEEIEVVLEFPRHTPEGIIVLRGATVITMRGDQVLRDADIVISGNRIRSVGPRGRAEIPADARIEELSGKTIVPGFIDTHAHWFEIRRGVMDVQNWSFLANLAYGVTAGLDVQTATNDMFAYQDLVDTGDILGPRPYSTGPGVFSNNNFQSAEEAEGVFARYKKYYRTRHLKSYIVGNRKQRQYVVQAAKKLEMMPTTEGGLDLKLDLTHAIDGFRGNEHALPIVPLFRDVVELFARSGIGYTPTLLVAYGGPWAENFFYTTTEVHDIPKLNRFMPHNLIDMKTRRRPWFREDEHVFSQIAASAAKIIRAGGRVGIGSHGQIQGIGYHWEMWALASGGLKPMEVLRAATLHGAEMIGYGEDLGSIEPGKLADLVILEKNPLDDIHNTNTIGLVMKNGELFNADSLDQVWPEQKPLEPLWWWEEGPS
ncbi:MAG: amidohydrolase family protein, partial [Acidobacteria bacterium]|nr:amidohydrolase family protein [Acidobacteriota bacterium]